MKKCTLVFPRPAPDKIILAKKKLKIGADLYNGWGGKIEAEDCGNIERAAVREFNQETLTARAKVEDLDKVAIINFFEAGVPIFECHVFFLGKWEDEIRESAEMGAPVEFSSSALPLDEMMTADKLWLPLLLEGKKFYGTCYYTEGNRAVEKFEYEPL